MSDGAHQGIDAERALGTIIGGEPQPTDDETMTVEQMTDWLLSAPRADDPAALASYGECARVVAGEILRWAYANPQRYAATPAETEMTWPEGSDGRPDYSLPPTVGALGLYDVLKAEGIDLGALGLSGFQWGWAYNAARRCLELPPEPNPAIITIGDGA